MPQLVGGYKPGSGKGDRIEPIRGVGICAHCGASFTLARSTRRYCSDACRHAANRASKKSQSTGAQPKIQPKSLVLALIEFEPELRTAFQRYRLTYGDSAAIALVEFVGKVQVSALPKKFKEKIKI